MKAGALTYIPSEIGLMRDGSAPRRPEASWTVAEETPLGWKPESGMEQSSLSSVSVLGAHARPAELRTGTAGDLPGP